MFVVSVIIPTRNRAELLQDAIESVLAVEHPDFALEVLVVDDGSTDETARAAAQYPVTLLHTPGVGASAARNAGILASRGDFIAFLDDDDVWLPTNLHAQLAAFARNPDYGAVHAQVRLTAPDRTCWPAVLPNGPLTSGSVFHDLLRYWPQLASVVIRRSVFADVGLFDVTLRNAEDWDLMLRIARHYPVGRVEEPVALFRQRCDNDEAHTFSELADMERVFHRHTADSRWWQRAALQRVILAHRGKIAAHLVHCAEQHSRKGTLSRAMRSAGYAFIASPAHAMKQPAAWRAAGNVLAAAVNSHSYGWRDTSRCDSERAAPPA